MISTLKTTASTILILISMKMDSLKELAEHFVDEGIFGTIPQPLIDYIDYDAIAYDLSMDYSETKIGEKRLIYRYV